MALCYQAKNVSDYYWSFAILQCQCVSLASFFFIIGCCVVGPKTHHDWMMWSESFVGTSYILKTEQLSVLFLPMRPKEQELLKCFTFLTSHQTNIFFKIYEQWKNNVTYLAHHPALGKTLLSPIVKRNEWHPLLTITDSRAWWHHAQNSS
jgi:hypothetical protein